MSQLVFNNEGRFCYRVESITCNMTGMVAGLYAGRALAAGVQASVRHAPPRTDPSDDEYESEM